MPATGERGRSEPRVARKEGQNMWPKRKCGVLICAWVSLPFGLTAPARAQKHEIGLTLGSIAQQDRTDSDGTQLSLESGTALQANYAYRLVDASITSVSIGVHFLANGSRAIDSANDALPRSLATLYVTPDLVVKLFPHGKLQPWATIGGGYAQYEA